VARAKPQRLFLIADGPRTSRDGEADRCAAVRKIVQGVDWKCEVTTNFSEENLGCKRRLSTGITWLFEQTEEAIILEDDCMPHGSFFRFADELLERYRNEPHVAQICGANFQGSAQNERDSYYFSRYPHIWGWASWRRAWRHYDVDMSEWPSMRDSGWLAKALGNSRQAGYWQRLFDRVHGEHIDTWDYQWTFACWKNDMLSIVPQFNLISNIGFGNEATHTKLTASPFSNIPSMSLQFPLQHPDALKRDARKDSRTDNFMFSGTRTPLGLARKACQWTLHFARKWLGR